jgi:hypothetical protein
MLIEEADGAPRTETCREARMTLKTDYEIGLPLSATLTDKPVTDEVGFDQVRRWFWRWHGGKIKRAFSGSTCLSCAERATRHSPDFRKKS